MKTCRTNGLSKLGVTYMLFRIRSVLYQEFVNSIVQLSQDLNHHNQIPKLCGLQNGLKCYTTITKSLYIQHYTSRVPSVPVTIDNHEEAEKLVFWFWKSLCSIWAGLPGWAASTASHLPAARVKVSFAQSWCRNPAGISYSHPEAPEKYRLPLSPCQ